MHYYGFNFLWFFMKERSEQPLPIDKKALDFIADEGFNFIRLPMDYNYWIHNFDYLNPDSSFFETIHNAIEAAQERGLHVSLNIHRAPGYCINRNDLERHNLWTDRIAQEGFIHSWKSLASHLADFDSDQLSFDLLNEPPNIGQYGMNRDNHAALMRETIAQIRSISPKRPITLDGLGGGNIPMPELADQQITQSCRGYQPMALTHYQAAWCAETADLPHPVYPGTEWEGKKWDRSTIAQHYTPWRELEKSEVPIHVGEMGCYTRVSNEVALRWFSDLLSLFKEWKWGYSLWEFEGEFGIIGHNRPETRYENYKGYRVDRRLLELLKKNRTE